ncbi:cell wall integrity and stress response component 2-like [Aphidius gifuensis]|uniref:cell wall integrity and stress response component 2-like n=1 Tax=Aphidius gifuensis TaxID=684658 RepID=UPI001CDCC96E|nr:cell wall integrity and stress response component 2-like [Aphidius gifuensis]
MAKPTKKPTDLKSTATGTDRRSSTKPTRTQIRTSTASYSTKATRKTTRSQSTSRQRTTSSTHKQYSPEDIKRICSSLTSINKIGFNKELCSFKSTTTTTTAPEVSDYDEEIKTTEAPVTTTEPVETTTEADYGTTTTESSEDGTTFEPEN